MNDKHEKYYIITIITLATFFAISFTVNCLMFLDYFY